MVINLKKPEPKYRAVMMGNGYFIVEKYGKWYDWFIFGSKWYQVSKPLRDLESCDDFVSRYKLCEAAKKNRGLVVQKYY